MTIKEPLLGQLNQGSIFSNAKAQRYPKCKVAGVVLTARCDLEQDKYNVLNYAPVVTLTDWLRVDGYELIISRIAADLDTRIASALKTVDLPLSILFTNFDNPMEAAASGFTELEERLCSEPIYYNVANEQALIETAFERADALQKELSCRRSDILIVSLSNQVVAELVEYAKARNKPALLLTKRGDAAAVGTARESAQWILGHADFVGGLEFQGVIVVGVDGGRVPPTTDKDNFSSKSFLSYVSHNRLYVAVSRARYRVEFLGEKARGPSRLLATAVESGLLSVQDL